MQIKPAILLRVLLTASILTLFSNAAAQDSSSSFIQALREAGWSVTKSTDGSLIITRQETPKEEAAPTVDQWPELQQKFQDAGWLVEREADGTLRLEPQKTTTIEKPQESSHDTVTSVTVDNAAVDQAAVDQAAVDQQTLQRKLRAAGWHVSRSSDGGMLLYPPGQAISGIPQPCPGTAPTVEVELPVDSWQEANDIARGWLMAQPPFYAAIGRIRKVLNVYLVSIVSDTAPFSLIQQIAIRDSDGVVIVLN